MACEIHKLDIGTVLRLTMLDCDEVILPINDATVKEIILKKPDKTVITRTASFTTNGIDGKIEYITVLDDLDIKGTWNIQGRIVTPSGEWKSSIAKFKVIDNL